MSKMKQSHSNTNIHEYNLIFTCILVVVVKFFQPSLLSLTTNKAPSSVIVIAGFNAACCAVPDNNPTADVSISDSIGPHNQIPIAGIAKYIIFFTSGASNPIEDDVVVVILDDDDKEEDVLYSLFS